MHNIIDGDEVARVRKEIIGSFILTTIEFIKSIIGLLIVFFGVLGCIMLISTISTFIGLSVLNFLHIVWTLAS